MKGTENKIGAYEAKTKLAELLDRAAGGEVITITKRNEPVARLVPARNPDSVNWERLFQQMDEIRAASILNPPGKSRLRIKDLIEEGRP